MLNCIGEYLQIGWCRIYRGTTGTSHMTGSTRMNPMSHDNTNHCPFFANSNFSLRLMESVAVCVSRNEPLLLVGGECLSMTLLIIHTIYLL